MALLKYSIITVLFLVLSTAVSGQPEIIYKFDLKEEIAPPAWRQTQAAFKQAEEVKADYMLIHLNTYGGMLDAADNIRTKILNSKIPVLVFIDNNAASAGALIAIACDSIYMSPGASMGAATVVDETGKPLPEKYQSYMRSILRSTAEANRRDPKIAEAMNDPRIYIPNVNDSGKVVTFTTSEAIKNNYCEAQAASVEELLRQAGIRDYTLTEYKKTSIESLIDFLLKPIVSSLLIMIIVACIYFELQAPGIGFPLFAAIGAALLYFAPLYLEGLAANWEIGLFVAGIILLLVELFVIPGFGVTGILGILCIVLGLALSLVESIPSGTPFDLPHTGRLARALISVLVAIVLSLVISVYMGGKLIGSAFFNKLVLTTTQDSRQGYTTASTENTSLVGKTGISHTVLRPSGKVYIEGNIYDAFAERGFIDKGIRVEVVRYESVQLVVRETENG